MKKKRIIVLILVVAVLLLLAFAAAFLAWQLMSEVGPSAGRNTNGSDEAAIEFFSELEEASKDVTEEILVKKLNEAGYGITYTVDEFGRYIVTLSLSDGSKRTFEVNYDLLSASDTLVWNSVDDTAQYLLGNYNGEIVTIDEVGRKTGTAIFSYWVVSPDEVLFSKGDVNGKANAYMDIYSYNFSTAEKKLVLHQVIYDAEDIQITNVGKLAGVEGYIASYSRDGRRGNVAYPIVRGVGMLSSESFTELVSRSYEGSGMFLSDKNVSAYNSNYTSISPDGLHIAEQYLSGENAVVYLHSIDTSSGSVVLTEVGQLTNAFEPVWLSNKTVVFTSTEDSAIYKHDITSNATILLHQPGNFAINKKSNYDGKLAYNLGEKDPVSGKRLTDLYILDTTTAQQSKFKEHARSYGWVNTDETPMFIDDYQPEVDVVAAINVTTNEVVNYYQTRGTTAWGGVVTFWASR